MRTTPAVGSLPAPPPVPDASGRPAIRQGARPTGWAGPRGRAIIPGRGAAGRVAARPGRGPDVPRDRPARPGDHAATGPGRRRADGAALRPRPDAPLPA